MLDYLILIGLAGILWSKTHEQLALFFLASGLVLSTIIVSNGLILAGIVQAIATTTGSIAILLFGGQLNEE